MSVKYRIAIQKFVSGEAVQFSNIVVHDPNDELGMNTVHHRIREKFKKELHQETKSLRRIGGVDFEGLDRSQQITVKDLIAQNKLSKKTLADYVVRDIKVIDEFIKNNPRLVKEE